MKLDSVYNQQPIVKSGRQFQQKMIFLITCVHFFLDLNSVLLMSYILKVGLKDILYGLKISVFT